MKDIDDVMMIRATDITAVDVVDTTTEGITIMLE